MQGQSKSLRVFVVDDDPDVLRSTVRVLGSDFEVTSSLDAEDLIGLLREGRTFDVVVSDVMMPKMNGLDLIRAVADLFGPKGHPPFVFLTGGCPKDVRQDLNARATVLDKPFSRSTLLEAIRSVVSRQ